MVHNVLKMFIFLLGMLGKSFDHTYS